MLLAVMLGATYQGCDLLGELAENMNAGIDNKASDGKNNDMEELKTGVKLQKSSQTSLRRSLSLVSLSELVTSMTVCDSVVPENQVAHCTANITQHMSSISCSSSKEQCAVDIAGHQEHCLDVSSDDSSFTELPPLSQRLGLNRLQSDVTVTDSVSGRGLDDKQLPQSGDDAESRTDKLENGCLKQSSQRTVNSDSALLPSRRRRALKLRTASILSDDDVFFDTAKPSDAKIKQHQAYSSESTDTENIDDSVSGTSDADIFQFNRRNSIHKESDCDIVQKFKSSLHISDKNEDLESVSTNESCLHKQNQVTETLDEFSNANYCVETDAATSSTDRLIGKSADISSQQFTEPVIWSPRHCGNFCIETSIVSTPNVLYSDSCENDLQVELSLCDNLNDVIRTSFDPVNTGNDISADADEVYSNVDAAGMSDLLFDDPVSPEGKLVLPLDVSEDRCNILVTENGDSHYNESDYSVIIID